MNDELREHFRQMFLEAGRSHDAAVHDDPQYSNIHAAKFEEHRDAVMAEIERLRKALNDAQAEVDRLREALCEVVDIWDRNIEGFTAHNAAEMSISARAALEVEP